MARSRDNVRFIVNESGEFDMNVLDEALAGEKYLPCDPSIFITDHASRLSR
jgi:hypothetical protein